MAEVIVDDLDIQDALISGMSDSRALKRAAIEFIDDAADTWRRVWTVTAKSKIATGADPHPYETGNYESHIKKKHVERISEKMIREAMIDGALLGSVYNDADDAAFLERGTQVDKPGSRSPYGPNTPTPAFEIAKRTAEIMGGRGEL